MRENHATGRQPMTREQAISEWRFIGSLRMDLIFCFRESTAIRAGESIARCASASGSDKTYLFFTDFRCGAIRPPDCMLLKPTGFSGKTTSGSAMASRQSSPSRIS
ncbi:MULTISPECIES: hypothetical protein [Burkholderia]|uniref:hypothetical protein n=1 Tax=Burkholderia TaxID=32008 RepID=UPI00117891D3|nr:MULTISPECIES: hypothetical protein [Burkholderia]EKS9798183.1 hypothetical protein [Burkholderia cepacia]EKS9804740.1 hypothetical protein [Burkholderia cepacia]EKS9812418.1 hypothetical protein [Burkholderia cepacia]EKS9819530.1 hypothetical protein [Burkholderia cepacia]EKS9827509.1 hypothetical protein [Burkholderia cepacia]